MGGTLLNTPRAPGLPEVPGYRLLRRLAEGEMGEIYLCMSDGSDSELVMRILRPALAEQPALVAEFVALSEALLKLRSPSVVQVLDLGRLASGAPFVVMERIAGRELHAILAEEAPLAPARVVSLARQVAEGLTVAHAAGLVHRNLTPANLRVGPGDALKIIDFAIASAPGGPRVEYRSPEQAGGAMVDARSDLYSLGVVLSEALSGKLPSDPRAEPIGGALGDVVQRCLKKDPAERYESATELADALDEIGAPAALDERRRTPTASYSKGGARAQMALDETTPPEETPTPALHEGEAKQAGDQLGSYRIVQLIGEGGMGRVYLAEHARLGRRVALKLLRDELSSDPQSVSRFFAEARAVNRIQHENIVEITDFIENPGGDNYYIMEFLPGLNLDQLIARDGRLPLARALGIAVQVCSALASVHEASIIHRDLKPENIFLTERGGQKDFVKVLDFGIAKLGAKDEAIAMHTTGVGTIMGTPEYMSPEQASGIAVDPRSDIYAVGIILYELVTGLNPFPGANFGEMLVRKLSETAPPPSSRESVTGPIPPELDTLVLHCLERDRDSRPQKISEVEERLRAIALAHAVELESFVPVSRSATARPAARPRMIVGLVAVAVAAIVGIVFGLRPGKVAPPVAPIAAPPIAPVVPTAPPVAPLAEEPPKEAAVVEAPPAKTVVVKPPKAHSQRHRNSLDGPSRRAVIDPFK